MSIKKIKDGVLQTENTNNYTVFDSSLRECLLHEAENSQLRRARINFHSPEARVHEMIICLMHDTNIAVHRHFDKSESFHLIFGSLCIVLFDSKTTTILEQVFLHANSTNCFYRLNSSLFHLVVPLTPYVIMHETTPGPFKPKDTEIAAWSLTSTGSTMVRSIVFNLQSSYD